MSGPLRVFKLGGSLLEWPQLPAEFRRWRAQQSPAVEVLIVGGGGLAEAVRRLDAARRLDPVEAHWLCIRAMSLTASIVASWLDEARLVRSLGAIDRSQLAPLQILDAEPFLRQDAGRGGALPCGWHVTSDSIAARAARLLEANELVLLKSTLPREVTSRRALGQAGFVDEYFATASQGLTVRAVNLRDDNFPQLAMPENA